MSQTSTMPSSRRRSIDTENRGIPTRTESGDAAMRCADTQAATIDAWMDAIYPAAKFAATATGFRDPETAPPGAPMDLVSP